MGMTGLAAVSVPALLGALTVIEAGIPLPIPGDVLMLLVGERAAASAVPLWLAVAGLEAVVLVGTAALFFAARGPLRGAIRRLGPRVGLTEQRVDRATSALEHRGQAAVAVGRATPSLRTLTVIATAASQLSAQRALALLVLGGSVFIQLHLVLGYLLGPVAEQVFRRAELPVLVALGVVVVAAAAYWLVRHGRRRGAHAWTEATCPACVAAHLVLSRLRIDTEVMASRGA
ncbi:MAG: hypothetical protein JOZ46_02525 [Candidatus Dormibacteraeota bacterium]|nr:hypothetical protein [Candidatus Dormibacteraeota bacterium]